MTELVARPLLNLHLPELAGFAQPLAGEVAAAARAARAAAVPGRLRRRDRDADRRAARVGLDALAQVDLGTRQNRHQPLRELAAMALAVLAAAERRVLGPEAADALAPGPYVLPGGPVDGRPPSAGRGAPPLADVRPAATRTA